MWSYSYFFSKNISIYAIFNDQSFNDTLTNDIFSFEQLGLGFFATHSQKILTGITPESNEHTHKCAGLSDVWRCIFSCCGPIFSTANKIKFMCPFNAKSNFLSR